MQLHPGKSSDKTADGLFYEFMSLRLVMVEYTTSENSFASMMFTFFFFFARYDCGLEQLLRDLRG